METKINKTTVKLEIDKGIMPKKYEPLKIGISIEESFCWTTEKERDAGMAKMVNKASDDFVVAFNEVCNKIGENNRCIGVISAANESNTAETEDGEWY